MSGKSASWNPWHGCHKYSAGCQNCYVYRGDSKRGRDSSIVQQTLNFDLPLRKKKNGEYKIPSGTLVYTCFSSDFFVEDADCWREEVWSMMRVRTDLHFLFITKRIERLQQCVPDDWGEGYENVTICCTMENQEMANYRLPIYKAAPIKHKIIICEPLLEKIDFSLYIGPWIEQIVVGGESGREARVCDYEWVLDIRNQCIKENLSFWFKQTGAKFIKDGNFFFIKRPFQHSQARKADINFNGDYQKR